MKQRISLAMMFLMTTYIAVGLLSIRSVFVERNPLMQNYIAETMSMGGLCGFVFAVCLNIWNFQGPGRFLLRLFGGTFIGIAAGAQLNLSLSWTTVLLIPAVVVATTIAVALAQHGKRFNNPTDSSLDPIASEVGM